MISSSKLLEVKLTDIWFECQKELIAMKNRLEDMKNCLTASEQINKHLLNCNQFLVNIIEKCKIEDQTDSKISALIKIIKTEEEAIESEKIKLRGYKRLIKSEFNIQRAPQLIADWKQCKRPLTLTEDKSIQTIEMKPLIPSTANGNDKTFRLMSEITGNIVKIDLNDENSDLPFNTEEVNCSVDISQLNERSEMNSPEIDLTFDDTSDIHMNEDSLDFNPESDGSESDTQLEDNWDSDYKDVKTTQSSKRTKRINSVVLPFKEGDLYVCRGFDCEFTSSVKRKFFTHFNKHHKSGLTHKINVESEEEDKVIEDGKYVCKQNDCNFKSNSVFRLRIHSKRKHKIEIPLSVKQQRMKLMISPYKVDKQYVCSLKDCDFKSTSGQKFYSHLGGHSTSIVRKRTAGEYKSNDSDRPYVCDWPECGWAFKKGAHLKLHRKRHLGHRDFKCDWPGCGAQMYTSHNYVTHRRTHTNERPIKCEWPGCLYSCNQKWALVAHGRKHTGEKPYACPFPECGYRCAQPCTLISHKRKHTGEKPYMCQVKGCNKRFTALAGIWNHKKSHAKKELKASMRQTSDETNSEKTKQKLTKKSSALPMSQGPYVLGLLVEVEPEPQSETQPEPQPEPESVEQHE